MDSRIPIRSALRAFASGKFLSPIPKRLKSVAPSPQEIWHQR
jgi:DNA-binding GntR family transcriptional regulator